MDQNWDFWTDLTRVDTLIIWMDQIWDIWTDVRIFDIAVCCDGSELGRLDWSQESWRTSDSVWIKIGLTSADFGWIRNGTDGVVIWEKVICWWFGMDLHMDCWSGVRRGGIVVIWDISKYGLADMCVKRVGTLVLLKLDQNWHSLVDVRTTGTRMDVNGFE